jgi:hypothetical protein
MKFEANKWCTKDPKEGYFINIEDLTKIAQILIEIQLMKSNFINFKYKIQ